MEPLLDESSLLSRARGGDLDAFNALVERYQAAVYNLCLRMLGAEQPAEDATQEAFISAYRNMGRYREGNFRSWLFRIAANACYDEMRRRKSRPAYSLDEPYSGEEHGLDPAGALPTMEEHAERLELRAAIEEALARLPA